MTDHSDGKDEAAEDRLELDEARREALAKMGRFAGYTAPVMLGLLGAKTAASQPADPPPPVPIPHS
jgi:hypothetical protein